MKSSRLVIRSFKNSIGQTVKVPKIFHSEKYIGYLQTLNGIQIGLNTVEIEVLGKTIHPKIGGVLPALTKIVFEILLENYGRKDTKGQMVKICADDVIILLDMMGVSALYRRDTLRVSFRNVVYLIRDYVNRQMSVEVYNRLRSYKIKKVKGTRGAPAKFFWLE